MNGKKRKKKRERARRGLKRFFTCHWPTSEISILMRGSPATCRASAINDYRRRFGHRVRYLIAPPTLASFFIGPSFVFPPTCPSPFSSWDKVRVYRAARLIGERIVASLRCIVAGVSSKPGWRCDAYPTNEASCRADTMTHSNRRGWANFSGHFFSSFFLENALLVQSE